MRPSGGDAIVRVRAFLTERVLPGVAEEHRSELRAALKLLDESKRELTERPRVLAEETHELHELCDRAYAALGRPAPSRAADHDAMRAEAERLVVALQEGVRVGGTGRDVLDDFYALLGRHAERRVPWQSVFTASIPGVPVPKRPAARKSRRSP